MDRKTLLSWLVFGLAFCLSVSLQAQKTSYYWSDNRQISLTEDHASVMIHFKKGVNMEQAIQQIAARKDKVQEVNFFPFRARAVVQLTQQQTAAKASDLLQSLGLNPESVRSISYAQDLEDGFPLYLTHRIVLRMRDGLGWQALSSYIDGENVKYLDTQYGNVLLEVNDIDQVLYMANVIRESGLVAFCHPDFYAEVTRTADPLYPEQFQMNNTGQTIDGYTGTPDIDIDGPEAWAITTGSSSITVAVIDDGVEAHEDLDAPVNGYTPLNGGNGAPVAGSAHAQSCAGIIVANHNNIGVRGVAPQSTLLTVNIFAGSETATDIANGVNWAVSNGADVLSNSWGYTSCTASFSVLTNALNDATTNGRGGKGCVVVFASGNDYASCVSYPANLSSVIAVGAVTNQGVRSSYSNYGPTLDLVAPSNGAAGVRTTDRMGSAGYNSTNYTSSFGGTSAACPVVSGVAALVLATDPNLTESEVKNILYSTADDMGPAGFDNEYGNGRVNAHQAVLSAQGGGSSCNAPTGLSAGSITSSSATLSWSAVSGASSYDVRIRPTGGAWTTTTGITGTSYNATGLTASTTYDFQVRTQCSGGTSSSWSATSSFTTLSGGPVYCASQGNNSSYEWISNVTLGSFSNNSGASGYTDFTGLTANVNAGSSYSFSVTPAFSGSTYQEYFRVWIDFNQDGDFADAGEEVFAAGPTSGTASGSISIPASATTGNTRMRVSMKWNGVPTSCETFSYGEVEDYTVNIGGAQATCDAPAGLSSSNITSSSATLSWSAVSGASTYDIRIRPAGGSWTTTTGITGTSYNATGLTASTTYEFQVRTQCTNGLTSAWSATASFTTQAPPTCDAPTGLSSSNITSSSATLSWSAASGASTYDIRIRPAGGSWTTTTGITGTSYNATGLTASTTYEFQVRTQCTNGVTSAWSATASFTTQAGGANYCSSQGNNSSYEWISNVTLGSFSNNSGAAGYSDFTSLTANVNAGSSYSFSVTPAFSGSTYQEYFRVWIDFNQDGDFTDAGEEVFAAGPTSGTASGNISIPASAALGSTRMRVSMKWNGVPTSCETFSYGEVEDYTVNIGNAPPSYCASQGNNSNYEWISNVTLGSFSNNSGASGYTDFTGLTANVTAGSSYSFSVTPAFSGSTYQEYFRVWIDFNQDGDFTDAGEEVFAAGPTSGTASGTVSIPSTALNGNTRMRVSMKWNAAPTSCETFSYGEVEDYTVNVSGGAANGSGAQMSFDPGTAPNTPRGELRIHPNPASDFIEVNLQVQEPVLGIWMTDISGQIRIELEQNDLSRFDVSDLPKGVYILFVKTEREQLIRRFVVQ